jgi:hypothetical protein
MICRDRVETGLGLTMQLCPDNFGTRESDQFEIRTSFHVPSGPGKVNAYERVAMIGK